MVLFEDEEILYIHEHLQLTTGEIAEMTNVDVTYIAEIINRHRYKKLDSLTLLFCVSHGLKLFL